ncbi:hypothetical protein O7632_05155 [Solwaraspora sp. WMMD406]|uniref:hypothetical protein n=1 Tax=Solwaraspora sp. WMMD406 TaxID=3016095 RepID=UPI0024163E31|nr:hypothetical protein [Solwaraspora sp. WMMD406]MDG4763499.1 hypothetical protein [Solwaraspora sp. WMMD406]
MRADIVRQVRPLRTRQRSRSVAVRAVVLAYAFTWLPAFLVFAVATVVAPSLTDGASVAATALWALQFATLIAISAIVTALRSLRAAEPDEVDADTSTRRTLLRLVGGLALSGLFAGLVLAVQGLSVGQIAVLAGVLAAVLHLLPLIAARLLARAASRRLDR